MAWFRKKGKYWYYVFRENNEEKQIYIGDHDKVVSKLLPKEKNRSFS